MATNQAIPARIRPARNNQLQFAVVREDPEIEIAVLNGMSANANVLLIGSGGCTAFAIRTKFPDLRLTILDPNIQQTEWIQRKIKNLYQPCGRTRTQAFGIGSDDPTSLTGAGNFESLFRSFRFYLDEFICRRESWLRFFAPGFNRAEFLEEVFAHKHWPVAFELFFSDSLLLAMFGPLAIQNAERGSYPRYFRRALESGLQRSDAEVNYFLHHIFLGHYLEDPACQPLYLQSSRTDQWEMEFVLSDAQNVPDFSAFDFISLSNIFDWMTPSDLEPLARRLNVEMKTGAKLIWRQLNNPTDVETLFTPALLFDAAIAATLLAKDRTLFYSSLHIGEKLAKANP